MKRNKRNTHCLLVEDEIYNWAPEQGRRGRRRLVVSILVILAAVMLTILAGI